MSGATVALEDLLREYAPGSRNPPWSWEDEARDIDSHPCPVELGRAAGAPVTPCDDPAPGCYQRKLEAHVAEHGLTQGVCLGTDGRVWDGHHRIVAAWRLGIARVPVEEALFDA